MFVKVENGVVTEYPYNIIKLYQENSNVSFPGGPLPDDLLALYNIYRVIPQPQPVYNKLISKAVNINPVQVNGVWTEQWQVVTLTQEEQQEKLNELKQSIVDATQERLDNFAKTRNYDGILSCCSYHNSTNTKFATEANYCIQARTDTWTTLYQILGEVETGVRPTPQGFSDIEPDLPPLQWTN